MKFLTGQKELPAKADMLRDTEREMAERWAKGYKKHQAHMMGPAQVGIWRVAFGILRDSNVRVRFFFTVAQRFSHFCMHA